MVESPAFSSFRKLMDIWDAASLIEAKEKEDKQGKIKGIIDGKNMIMFFKNGNSIFGAPEESRIMFAQLLNPDDDFVTEDPTFMAYDLLKTLGGQDTQNIFSAKDIPGIDVITRDEAETELMKCPCQNAPQPTVSIQAVPLGK